MKQLFNVGGFRFEICADSDLIIPDMFRKFTIADGNADPDYVFRISNAAEIIEDPADIESVITRKQDLTVGASAAGEYRFISIKGLAGYYARYREVSDSYAEILIREDFRENLNLDTIFTSLFALERHMMKRKHFVLHCSFMVHQGEAILFSAPSETGKTTQANLWQKYRGSRTVNGDRALLSIEDGKLYADGWPVCGSSEICENERFPVRAIVMLSQGTKNQIRRISGREAFFQLYSQVTINSWNQEFVNSGMDFIEEILKNVPVYHLSCTISEKAVEVLESTLY